MLPRIVTGDVGEAAGESLFRGGTQVSNSVRIWYLAIPSGIYLEFMSLQTPGFLSSWDVPLKTSDASTEYDQRPDL